MHIWDKFEYVSLELERPSGIKVKHTCILDKIDSKTKVLQLFRSFGGENECLEIENLEERTTPNIK